MSLHADGDSEQLASGTVGTRVVLELVDDRRGSASRNACLEAPIGCGPLHRSLLPCCVYSGGQAR